MRQDTKLMRRTRELMAQGKKFAQAYKIAMEEKRKQDRTKGAK